MTSMSMNYAALLPEAVLLAAAVIALLGGSFLPRNRQSLVRWFTLGALVVSAGAAAVAASGPETSIFDGTYAIDIPTALVRVLAPLCTAIVIVIGRRDFHNSPRESETYTLLVLATLGTVVMGGPSTCSSSSQRSF